MAKIKYYIYRWLGVIPTIVGMGVAVLASSVYAQGTTPLPTNILSSPSAVQSLFCDALLWMFWGLVVLGVAMFLVGGYTYATSSGDAEKVSKATKTLTYAAIALVVGIVAKVVPSIISSFLGAGSLNACS